MELEELMMGMVELPILYNTLFPAVNNAPDVHLASGLAIRASESFNKQELLSVHKADGAKFTSWLEYVDTISASKEKARKERQNGKYCGGSNGKGLLLRLRESVVEIPRRPPAPLGNLKAVRVSELRLDEQHYGRVLYGTLCAQAFKMTAVLTLLEDPRTGHVIKLAIYNAVPSTAILAEVQAQFPEGSRVAIKEPYFKRYKDQTVGLRVNNPGDVVFLGSSVNPPSERERLLAGAPAAGSTAGIANNMTDLVPQLNMNYDELRLEGNRAFSSGEWRRAVHFYTTSINMALNSTKSWKLDSTPALCEPPLASYVTSSVTSLGKKLPAAPCNDSVQKQAIKRHTENVNTAVVKPLSKKSAKKVSKQRISGDNTTSKQQQQQQQQGRSHQSKADLKAEIKAESALLAAYSNRSEAWLRLHKYNEALVDAENALKMDPTHVKSMFRRGRALHCLQQYSKAVQCLQSALVYSPHDSELERALKESLTGDLQSRLGVYDLSSYYLGDLSGPPPPCADFVGPVKVQMLESKYGRGSGQRGLVVTSKSVKAGDLLLVSNPLAVARVEGENIEFHLIPATRRMNDASQEDLVTQLYNCARVSPGALHQLQSLYNGRGSESTVPSMELFVPRNSGFEPRPNNSNAGLMLEPRENNNNNNNGTTQAHAPQQQPDITKIRQIVQWNAFDEHGYTTKGGGGPGRRGLRGFCSGIWVLPSFINHSCLPNASRVHVGNAMMIYAARDLEAGDEVCIPYFDILSPLPQRRETSLRGWGFICKCPRCMLEEGLQTEMKHITDRFSRLEDEALPRTAMIQDPTVAVAKMSSTYLGNGFSRHARQFLGLARDVEALLSTNKKLAQFGSDPTKQNWLRASYASAYIVGSSNVSAVASYSNNFDSESRIHFLTTVLESLGDVFPGNYQTLSTATMLMDELRKRSGIKSQAFRNAEERAMYICRCIFGNQKVPVLRSLIKALQEGTMEV